MRYAIITYTVLIMLLLAIGNWVSDVIVKLACTALFAFCAFPPTTQKFLPFMTHGFGFIIEVILVIVAMVILRKVATNTPSIHMPVVAAAVVAMALLYVLASGASYGYSQMLSRIDLGATWEYKAIVSQISHAMSWVLRAIMLIVIATFANEDHASKSTTLNA